jgi:predicted nucleic acid-binding Zn ribbon protein
VLRRNDIHRICASCSNTPTTDEQECESTECPILYSRMRSKAEVSESRAADAVIDTVWTAQRLRKLAARL